MNVICINLTVDPKKDFIILESLNRKNEDKAKVVYKVIFDEKLDVEEIHIGRDKNINDFIEPDESVSKIHGIFKKYKNGNIIIEDKNSKYGSYVLIKKSIKIIEEPINIQIGRSYVASNLIIDKNKK